MARPSFSDAANLAAARADATKPIIEQPTRQAPAPSPTRAPAPEKPRIEAVPDQPRPAAAPALYKSLVRGESRLTREQINGLNDLARELSSAREDKEGTNTITKNTLLRVGARLLLEYRDELSGEDEDQLLDALRRAVRG
jgi:hypothetical protein